MPVAANLKRNLEPEEARPPLDFVAPSKRVRTVAPVLRGVLPEGNLLLAPRTYPNIRDSGLGALARLNDPLLLRLLSAFSPVDVLSLACCSRAALAFAFHEPLWKEFYLNHRDCGGRLKSWQGNWRKTFLVDYSLLTDEALQELGASDGVQAAGLYSDVLYQPSLCIQVDIERYFIPRRAKLRHNILIRQSTEMSVDEFVASFAAPSQPVKIQGAMSAWPSFIAQWSPEVLRTRWRHTQFRAEAFNCSMETYLDYASNCAEDDSPLYLFDGQFVDITNGSMGDEYEVPAYFREDLFQYMRKRRPDYRWLIVGPARSGSTFHKDPNHTSAWNAVISGRKGWVMFPPDVIPPGVYVTPDEAEVTSPLSIAEWFLSYFDEAWNTYGPHGSDPSYRNKMKVGVCGAGEMIFVPSGWWHLVVNLDFSVAVTQNYVSSSEIGQVLSFMRDRPSQISGFKQEPSSLVDADNQESWKRELLTQFCDSLRDRAPQALKQGLAYLDRVDRKKRRATGDTNEWKMDSKTSSEHGAFSFDFIVEEDENDRGGSETDV